MAGGVGSYVPEPSDPEAFKAFMQEVRTGVTDPMLDAGQEPDAVDQVGYDPETRVVTLSPEMMEKVFGPFDADENVVRRREDAKRRIEARRQQSGGEPQ